MNKRILSVTLLFAVLFSGGVFAASSTLIPAMAALDKAYIPVLGLSGQADQQAKAKTAFTTFENVWKDFKTAFAADLDVAIARWKKTKAMEGLISDAALSPKADETYKSQWQAINSIMAGTKSAFEAGDEKTFSEKLGQLKPNFIKTFFLFGDFPR